MAASMNMPAFLILHDNIRFTNNPDNILFTEIYLLEGEHPSVDHYFSFHPGGSVYEESHGIFILPVKIFLVGPFCPVLSDCLEGEEPRKVNVQYFTA